MGGLFDLLYKESINHNYRTRTRITKIHDFVPFGICQDPVKLFLTFFSKNFEIFDVKTFWWVLEHEKKMEKNSKKKIFDTFLMLEDPQKF